MAHNFTSTDGMFTVREPAWHGLGNLFEDYPSRTLAQSTAHPWEVITEPVFRREPVIATHEHDDQCQPNCDYEETTIDYAYHEVTGWAANVRSDNDDVLGIVSSTYEVISNTEMWDIAEALQGQSKDVMFETAGSLKGGSKVWILVRLEEPLVIKGDHLTATLPYYALQNSHDGSGSFRGQSIARRIVCDNTAQMADMEAKASGTEYTFRHTSNVRDRLEEAKVALAGWRQSTQNYRLQSEYLFDQPVTPYQKSMFIERFLPMPAPHISTERVMQNVENARIKFRDMLNSETCETINHTAYGLVQASIEYLNWGRNAHGSESRFKRAYLDRNRIVTDAVDLAMAVSKS